MKLADPATEVVAGGMSIRALAPGGYLDRLYALGAAPYFDTLAVHPYAVGVGAVVAHVRRTRAIAAAHGDADVPLRVTEYGYATGGRSAWVAGSRCQGALIAATTRELSARRAAFGLRSITELQWQDRRADASGPWPDHAGLRFADGSPKPALAAFRRALRGRPPRARADVAPCAPLRTGAESSLGAATACAGQPGEDAGDRRAGLLPVHALHDVRHRDLLHVRLLLGRG